MLEDQSVEKIIHSINQRQISIKELMEYYLDRIEKFNPDLNAIVLLKDRGDLIKEAINKDNSTQFDNTLNGIPIAIKDLSDVVGIKTTYGYPGTKDYFPKKNSLFVERLIKSGAIIIGKTNTAELGVGGHTINRLFGPTSNYYDNTKSAAGSSGGASTAVAAGLIPFADGTDQMGSCRGPAAYANIYGYRPTPGLISVDRGNQLSKIPILTTPGCLAKSPSDMAFLLDEMIGSDTRDNYSFELKELLLEKKNWDLVLKTVKDPKNLNDLEKNNELVLQICRNRWTEGIYDISIENINTTQVNVKQGLLPVIADPHSFNDLEKAWIKSKKELLFKL